MIGRLPDACASERPIRPRCSDNPPAQGEYAADQKDVGEIREPLSGDEEWQSELLGYEDEDEDGPAQAQHEREPDAHARSHATAWKTPATHSGDPAHDAAQLECDHPEEECVHDDDGDARRWRSGIASLEETRHALGDRAHATGEEQVDGVLGRGFLNRVRKFDSCRGHFLKARRRAQIDSRPVSEPASNDEALAQVATAAGPRGQVSRRMRRTDAMASAAAV